MRYSDNTTWSMISGNYYPVINTLYMADNDLQFTVLHSAIEQANVTLDFNESINGRIKPDTEFVGSYAPQEDFRRTMELERNSKW